MAIGVPLRGERISPGAGARSMFRAGRAAAQTIRAQPGACLRRRERSAVPQPRQRPLYGAVRRVPVGQFDAGVGVFFAQHFPEIPLLHLSL